MSAVWQPREDLLDVDALVGYDVEAVDGGIGSVDEASWGTDNDHLVVDTGPWIFGRKVLIPAGVIDRVDRANRVVHLAITKQEVKEGPLYDESRHGSGEPDVWRPYEDYYGNRMPMPPLT